MDVLHKLTELMGIVARQVARITLNVFSEASVKVELFIIVNFLKQNVEIGQI